MTDQVTAPDPAALLRQAAGILRQHADAATPGPWVHDDHGPLGANMGCGLVMTEHPDGFGGGIADPADPYQRGINRPTGNMAYIALMHPPVAVALADLLESLAPLWDGLTGSIGDSHEALAVAQAIVDSQEASS